MRLTVDINWVDAWEETRHPRGKGGVFAAAHGASEGMNEPLTPTEKSTAHAKLESLTAHPHPWDEDKDEADRHSIVKPEDVGFKKPPVTMLGGASHTGKGWYRDVDVPINAINRSQPWISKAGTHAYIDNINKNPELPELAHGWGAPDEYHVISGHTRLSAQALANREKIRARIYHYEPTGKWNKPWVQVRPPKSSE